MYYLAFKTAQAERAMRFAALHHLATQTTSDTALNDDEADALIEAARKEHYRTRTAVPDQE